MKTLGHETVNSFSATAAFFPSRNLLILVKNILLKSLYISVILILITLNGFAQFSFATDASVMYSFQKRQQFWAIGQTLKGEFEFSSKINGFLNLAYYSNGRFSNTQTATSKAAATIPSSLSYRVASELGIKNISIGAKYFLVGKNDQERGYNLYGIAGLGLMFANISNQTETPVDTSLYNTSITLGKGNFKRLTLDLGLGIEKNVGADVFLYGESKFWIPSSGFPSPYLQINKNAPFVVTANLGLRILF